MGTSVSPCNEVHDAAEEARQQREQEHLVGRCRLTVSNFVIRVERAHGFSA